MVKSKDCMSSKLSSKVAWEEGWKMNFSTTAPLGYVQILRVASILAAGHMYPQEVMERFKQYTIWY